MLPVGHFSRIVLWVLYETASSVIGDKLDGKRMELKKHVLEQGGHGRREWIWFFFVVIDTIDKNYYNS